MMEGTVSQGSLSRSLEDVSLSADEDLAVEPLGTQAIIPVVVRSSITTTLAHKPPARSKEKENFRNKDG